MFLGWALKLFKLQKWINRPNQFIKFRQWKVKTGKYQKFKWVYFETISKNENSERKSVDFNDLKSKQVERIWRRLQDWTFRIKAWKDKRTEVYVILPIREWIQC